MSNFILSDRAFDQYLPSQLTNEIPHLSTWDILNKNLKNGWAEDLIGEAKVHFSGDPYDKIDFFKNGRKKSIRFETYQTGVIRITVQGNNNVINSLNSNKYTPACIFDAEENPHFGYISEYWISDGYCYFALKNFDDLEELTEDCSILVDVKSLEELRGQEFWDFSSTKLVEGKVSSNYGPTHVRYSDPDDPLNVYEADIGKIDFEVNGVFELEMDYLTHEMTRYLSKLYPEDFNALVTLTEAERQSYFNEALHLMHSYFDTTQLEAEDEREKLYFLNKFLTGITAVRAFTGSYTQETLLSNLVNTQNKFKSFNNFPVYASDKGDRLISVTNLGESAKVSTLYGYTYSDSTSVTKALVENVKGKINDSLSNLNEEDTAEIKLSNAPLRRWTKLSSNFIEDMFYGGDNVPVEKSINYLLKNGGESGQLGSRAVVETLISAWGDQTVVVPADPNWNWGEFLLALSVGGNYCAATDDTGDSKFDLQLMKDLQNTFITPSVLTWKDLNNNPIINVGELQYTSDFMKGCGNLIHHCLCRMIDNSSLNSSISACIASPKSIFSKITITQDDKKVVEVILQESYLKKLLSLESQESTISYRNWLANYDLTNIAKYIGLENAVETERLNFSEKFILKYENVILKTGQFTLPTAFKIDIDSLGSSEGFTVVGGEVQKRFELVRDFEYTDAICGPSRKILNTVELAFNHYYTIAELLNMNASYSQIASTQNGETRYYNQYTVYEDFRTNNEFAFTSALVSKWITSEQNDLNLYALNFQDCEFLSRNLLRIRKDLTKEISEKNKVPVAIFDNYGNSYFCEAVDAWIENDWCVIKTTNYDENDFSTADNPTGKIVFDFNQIISSGSSESSELYQRKLSNKIWHKNENLFIGRWSWEDLNEQNLKYALLNFEGDTTAVYGEDSVVGKATNVANSLCVVENANIIDVQGLDDSLKATKDLIQNLIDENKSLYIDSSFKILQQVPIGNGVTVYNPQYNTLSYGNLNNIPSSISYYYFDINAYPKLGEVLDFLNTDPSKLAMEDISKLYQRKYMIWGGTVWDGNNTDPTIKRLRTIWGGYLSNFSFVSSSDLLPEEYVVQSIGYENFLDLSILNYDYAYNQATPAAQWDIQSMMPLESVSYKTVEAIHGYESTNLLSDTEETTLVIKSEASNFKGVVQYLAPFTVHKDLSESVVKGSVIHNRDLYALTSYDDYSESVYPIAGRYDTPVTEVDWNVNVTVKNSNLTAKYDSTKDGYSFYDLIHNGNDVVGGKTIRLEILDNVLYTESSYSRLNNLFSDALKDHEVSHLFGNALYWYWNENSPDSTIIDAATVFKYWASKYKAGGSNVTIPTMVIVKKEKVILIPIYVTIDGKDCSVYKAQIEVPISSQLINDVLPTEFKTAVFSTEDDKKEILTILYRKSIRAPSKDFVASFEDAALKYVQQKYNYKTSSDRSGTGDSYNPYENIQNGAPINTYEGDTEQLTPPDVLKLSSSEVNTESNLVNRQVEISDNTENFNIDVYRMEGDDSKKTTFTLKNDLDYFKEYHQVIAQLSSEETDSDSANIKECHIEFPVIDTTIPSEGYAYLCDVKVPDRRTSYTSSKEIQLVNRYKTISQLNLVAGDLNGTKLTLLSMDNFYENNVQNLIEDLAPIAKGGNLIGYDYLIEQDLEDNSQLKLGLKWPSSDVNVGYSFFKKKFVASGVVQGSKPKEIKLIRKDSDSSTLSDRIEQGDEIEVILSDAPAYYSEGEAENMFDISEFPIAPQSSTFGENATGGPYKVIYKSNATDGDGEKAVNFIIAGIHSVFAMSLEVNTAKTVAYGWYRNKNCSDFNIRENKITCKDSSGWKKLVDKNGNEVSPEDFLSKLNNEGDYTVTNWNPSNNKNLEIIINSVDTSTQSLTGETATTKLVLGKTRFTTQDANGNLILDTGYSKYTGFSGAISESEESKFLRYSGELVDAVPYGEANVNGVASPNKIVLSANDQTVAETTNGTNTYVNALRHPAEIEEYDTSIIEDLILDPDSGNIYSDTIEDMTDVTILKKYIYDRLLEIAFTNQLEVDGNESEGYLINFEQLGQIADYVEKNGGESGLDLSRVNTDPDEIVREMFLAGLINHEHVEGSSRYYYSEIENLTQLSKYFSSDYKSVRIKEYSDILVPASIKKISLPVLMSNEFKVTGTDSGWEVNQFTDQNYKWTSIYAIESMYGDNRTFTNLKDCSADNIGMLKAFAKYLKQTSKLYRSKRCITSYNELKDNDKLYKVLFDQNSATLDFVNDNRILRSLALTNLMYWDPNDSDGDASNIIPEKLFFKANLLDKIIYSSAAGANFETGSGNTYKTAGDFYAMLSADGKGTDANGNGIPGDLYLPNRRGYTKKSCQEVLYRDVVHSGNFDFELKEDTADAKAGTAKYPFVYKYLKANFAVAKSGTTYAENIGANGQNSALKDSSMSNYTSGVGYNYAGTAGTDGIYKKVGSTTLTKSDVDQLKYTLEVDEAGGLLSNNRGSVAETTYFGKKQDSTSTATTSNTSYKNLSWSMNTTISNYIASTLSTDNPYINDKYETFGKSYLDRYFNKATGENAKYFIDDEEYRKYLEYCIHLDSFIPAYFRMMSFALNISKYSWGNIITSLKDDFENYFKDRITSQSPEGAFAWISRAIDELKAAETTRSTALMNLASAGSASLNSMKEFNELAWKCSVNNDNYNTKETACNDPWTLLTSVKNTYIEFKNKYFRYKDWAAEYKTYYENVISNKTTINAANEILSYLNLALATGDYYLDQTNAVPYSDAGQWYTSQVTTVLHNYTGTYWKSTYIGNVSGLYAGDTAGSHNRTLARLNAVISFYQQQLATATNNYNYYLNKANTLLSNIGNPYMESWGDLGGWYLKMDFNGDRIELDNDSFVDRDADGIITNAQGSTYSVKYKYSDTKVAVAASVLGDNRYSWTGVSICPYDRLLEAAEHYNCAISGKCYDLHRLNVKCSQKFQKTSNLGSPSGALTITESVDWESTEIDPLYEMGGHDDDIGVTWGPTITEQKTSRTGGGYTWEYPIYTFSTNGTNDNSKYNALQNRVNSGSAGIAETLLYRLRNYNLKKIELDGVQYYISGLLTADYNAGLLLLNENARNISASNILGTVDTYRYNACNALKQFEDVTDAYKSKAVEVVSKINLYQTNLVDYNKQIAVVSFYQARLSAAVAEYNWVAKEYVKFTGCTFDANNFLNNRTSYWNGSKNATRLSTKLQDGVNYYTYYTIEYKRSDPKDSQVALSAIVTTSDTVEGRSVDDLVDEMNDNIKSLNSTFEAMKGMPFLPQNFYEEMKGQTGFNAASGITAINMGDYRKMSSVVKYATLMLKKTESTSGTGMQLCMMGVADWPDIGNTSLDYAEINDPTSGIDVKSIPKNGGLFEDYFNYYFQKMSNKASALGLSLGQNGTDVDEVTAEATRHAAGEIVNIQSNFRALYGDSVSYKKGLHPFALTVDLDTGLATPSQMDISVSTNEVSPDSIRISTSEDTGTETIYLLASGEGINNSKSGEFEISFEDNLVINPYKGNQVNTFTAKVFDAIKYFDSFKSVVTATVGSKTVLALTFTQNKFENPLSFVSSVSKIGVDTLEVADSWLTFSETDSVSVTVYVNSYRKDNFETGLHWQVNGESGASETEGAVKLSNLLFPVGADSTYADFATYENYSSGRATKNGIPLKHLVFDLYPLYEEVADDYKSKYYSVTDGELDYVKNTFGRSVLRTPNSTTTAFGSMVQKERQADKTSTGILDLVTTPDEMRETVFAANKVKVVDPTDDTVSIGTLDTTVTRDDWESFDENLYQKIPKLTNNPTSAINSTPYRDVEFTISGKLYAFQNREEDSSNHQIVLSLDINSEDVTSLSKVLSQVNEGVDQKYDLTDSAAALANSTYLTNTTLLSSLPDYVKEFLGKQNCNLKAFNKVLTTKNVEVFLKNQTANYPQLIPITDYIASKVSYSQGNIDLKINTKLTEIFIPKSGYGQSVISKYKDPLHTLFEEGTFYSTNISNEIPDFTINKFGEKMKYVVEQKVDGVATGEYVSPDPTSYASLGITESEMNGKESYYRSSTGEYYMPRLMFRSFKSAEEQLDTELPTKNKYENAKPFLLNLGKYTVKSNKIIFDQKALMPDMSYNEDIDSYQFFKDSMRISAKLLVSEETMDSSSEKVVSLKVLEKEDYAPTLDDLVEYIGYTRMYNVGNLVPNGVKYLGNGEYRYTASQLPRSADVYACDSEGTLYKLDDDGKLTYEHASNGYCPSVRLSDLNSILKGVPNIFTDFVKSSEETTLSAYQLDKFLSINGCNAQWNESKNCVELKSSKDFYSFIYFADPTTVSNFSYDLLKRIPVEGEDTWKGFMPFALNPGEKIRLKFNTNISKYNLAYLKDNSGNVIAKVFFNTPVEEDSLIIYSMR